jgi:UDP-N-acetylmuramoyl-tripeptide--D-alanyl-D-alanine ligase
MGSSIRDIYDIYLQTGLISSDTRNIVPGSIFFALKGERFDGNKFAVQAIEGGCRIAVVDDEALKGKEKCFWVPDTLKALQELAQLHRTQLRIPAIGITGSNGKTTTKELVSAVLDQKFKVWHTQGNLNNHIGVPLTLLSIPPGTEIVVVEMGANHIGEIAGLCRIALPDYGLITNVGEAHLEGFGSFEGVRKGKGELYDFLKSNAGEIFINIDNEWLVDMAGDYQWIGYGTHDGAVVKASDIAINPFLSFSLSTSKVSDMVVNTRLVGLYNLENVLAAAAVGHYFGVEEELVKKAVEDYISDNNRSQFTDTGRNLVFLDAYNANPSSMKGALENFGQIQHHKKILVLGSMKEMGDRCFEEHKILIQNVLKMAFSKCYLTGKEFPGLVPDDERVQYFDDTETLKAALKEDKIRDAMILVKGSRANRLEKVIDVL